MSQMMSQRPMSKSSAASNLRSEDSGLAPFSRLSHPVGPARELPDVTGFLVVVVVAVGLFIVPVGATLMQGPAIVASLFSR